MNTFQDEKKTSIKDKLKKKMLQQIKKTFKVISTKGYVTNPH